MANLHKRKERERMKWIWADMVQRCNNPRHKAYKNYGGRGINVCESWRCLKNFLQDIGERPKDHLLDRIDNDKGYCKENCRWTTRKQQNNNRRMCIEVTYLGEKYNLKQIWEKYCKNTELTYRAFVKRFRNGYPLELCIFGKIKRGSHKWINEQNFGIKPEKNTCVAAMLRF